MKKKLSSLAMHQTSLELWDADGKNYSINIDGLKGEFTEKEWLEDETIKLFDRPGQWKIISTLKTYEII